jgi:catechol 2,3-dioxygenase-like lactoylglutathione lyase family enzyme
VIQVEGVDYVRVPVTDIEQAKEFYGKVLGLPPGPSQLDDWVEYQAGNLTLAVMTPESHGESFSPIPSGTIGLRVPDVAAAKASLEEAGVQVNDVWDSGVCKGASFRDPSGNMLTLHRRYAPHG